MSPLDTVTQLFFTDRPLAMSRLSDLVEGATGPRRAPLLQDLVARVGHEHPGLAAYFALAAATLVEDDEESTALGRALVAPLARALTAAARMLDHVAHLPEVEGPGPGPDPGPDAGDDGEPQVQVGERAVDRTMLDAIAEHDLVAVQAWFSMEIWFRPAVATWTRDPAVLRDVQQNLEVHAALARLGSATESSHWLSLLVATLCEARLVVMFPEIDAAWQLTADGVTDLGQLCVLLSAAMREPLARIGVTEVASEEVLAVMRGEGPQELDATYACAFRCYLGPGMPRDLASPGLPPDFQPGSLPVVDGARVLVVVGPRAPGGPRHVQEIPAVCAFDGLAARLADVTQLPAGALP